MNRQSCKCSRRQSSNLPVFCVCECVRLPFYNTSSVAQVVAIDWWQKSRVGSREKVATRSLPPRSFVCMATTSPKVGTSTLIQKVTCKRNAHTCTRSHRQVLNDFTFYLYLSYYRIMPAMPREVVVAVVVAYVGLFRYQQQASR